MKRILPAIPAFLLCLLGGGALGELGSGRKSEKRVIETWRAESIGGYDTWKTAADDNALTTEMLKEQEVELKQIPNVTTELTRLETELGGYRNTIEENADRNAKLGPKVNRLNETKEALVQKDREWSTVKDQGFEKRLEWRQTYETAKKEYETAKKEYEAAKEQYDEELKKGKPE